MNLNFYFPIFYFMFVFFLTRLAELYELQIPNLGLTRERVYRAVRGLRGISPKLAQQHISGYVFPPHRIET